MTHQCDETGHRLSYARRKALEFNLAAVPGRRLGKFSLIVETNLGLNGRTPLFFVGMPVGLLHSIEREHPIYLIPTGNFVEVGPAERVSYISSILAKEIMSARIPGPIAIGGYCLNGYIAYHLAHLLAKAGVEVVCLVIIDICGRSRPLDLYCRLSSTVRRFISWSENRLMRTSKNGGVIQDQRPEERHLFLPFQDMTHEAGHQYKPPVYRGDALLILSERGPWGSLPRYFQFAGWSTTLKGRISVRLAPGDQYTLFSHGNEAHIGKIINNHLRAVSA